MRDLYFHLLKEQQSASVEETPEFDAVAIWRQIVDEHMTDFARRLPAEMPVFLAEMYRGIGN